LIHHRRRGPAEFLAHNLETEGIPVEPDHSIEVTDMNRNVVDAPDHGFEDDGLGAR